MKQLVMICSLTENSFRYLCGNKYPEGDDICNIDPNADGMTLLSRKYQFWLQCEQIEHYSRLFQQYVLSDDRFSEVDDCFAVSGDDNLKHFLDKKSADTESTKRFATDLKDQLQSTLDTAFKEFKKKLREFEN